MSDHSTWPDAQPRPGDDGITYSERGDYDMALSQLVKRWRDEK